LVIGGGSIGLELGQALSRLSIAVKLIHSHDTLGTLSDPVVNQYVLDTLKKEMDIHTGERADINMIENSPSQVLLAMGRKPNLEELNLKEIGVQFDDKGIPLHDPETLKIHDFPIYLAGDVLNFRPVLHEAIDTGMMVGFNAEEKVPECFDRRVPMNIIFTDPNIAIIGSSYKELKEKEKNSKSNFNFVIGESFFDNQGRATIMSKNKGILHIYANENDGLLLGAEIFVPLGEHMAHLLALSIQQHLTVYDLLKMPFYHPVLEEGLRTALHDLVTKLKIRKTTTELLMCDNSGIEKLR
jgi:dihydrolipoamide dehydrogenase